MEEAPRLSQVKFSCPQTPGISSYAKNPEQAADSLKHCITQAVAAIPAGSRKTAQLHLRATAGMRVLHADNATQAEAVLSACRTAFAASGLGGAVSAEILPGELEGAFGWISANYLANVLGFGKGQALTTGALDMGGASTQITFRVPTSTVLPPGDAYTMRLFGLDELLYTHSYLCYGMGATTDRKNAALIAAASKPGPTVADPCLPVGATTPLSVDALAALATGYCTNGSGLEPAPSASLTLVGASNSTACAKQVSALRPTPARQQPAVSQDSNGFYAFSGYFYTVDYLCAVRKLPGCVPAPGPGLGWRMTPANLTAYAALICGEDMPTLRNRSQGVKDKFLQGYCLSATYLASVLDTYGFSPTSLNVAFVAEVNDRDVGWTLGFMLAYTTEQPAGPKAAALLSSATKIGGTIAGVLLLLGGIVLSVYLLRKRRSANYTPLI